jgi:hypothetical protein
MLDPDRSEGQADAPEQPGLAPTWTSSAKDAVGCPLGPPRVWFTPGHGERCRDEDRKLGSRCEGVVGRLL